MQTTKRFITIADAASMWGVDHTTVLSWIRSKRLRAVKLGGSYRLRPSDVEAFELSVETIPVSARDGGARMSPDVEATV
jgi:excisionase family DNA binding protein